ncbi:MULTISPECIES: homoserine kinase [unclassified Aeromicrobium]|uniref:homoserine kinase n=1 Tax=unclassified Aeromicrobium TaxID=2633570 RepID=UPI0006FE1749|nr:MULTISPECIES: homoserine kinase [unclassified Aeromicrobium]KQO38660.1 homoserine kinase [Aeromicrobium sp. Leaf245]KQP25426.1 homoserine kinase [Aeromicrobium sp. Leaf272]KQP80004.1 homoserine kinase [Aeromicrobium sp. Leaf289]KQP81910.1 homoserine kinase [Aeromicrobium sp. Leaf291]
MTSPFVDRPVTVRTPASSANLGPGFDALGLALDVHDELTAEVLPGDALEIVVEGEGADEVSRDAGHLVVRSFDAALDLMGLRRPGLRLTCRNVVPHGRGMGSSSAAIVGGIVLAKALVEGVEVLDDRATLQLAHDLEGHPDNVAAALLGGLTIAWTEGFAAEALRLDVAVPVTLFVPDSPVSTEAARGLLPDAVPHADAAANAGRAALLVAALTQAPERLAAATEDLLHQQYRASAMPDSYQLVRSLRVDGVPAVISGAGPTVLAFARGVAQACPDGWRVLEVEVADRGAHVVDAP